MPHENDNSKDVHSKLPMREKVANCIHTGEEVNVSGGPINYVNYPLVVAYEVCDCVLGWPRVESDSEGNEYPIHEEPEEFEFVLQ